MHKKPGKHKPRVSTVLRTYWSYTKKHPIALATIIAGALLLQTASLVAPLFLKKLFNILATSARTPESAHLLLQTLAVVASMWCLDWVARRIQGFTITNLQSKIMAVLQTDSFQYLQGHSNNFFVSNFAGSLTHKVKQFSRSYEVIFDSFIFQFFPTFLFVVGAVSILFVRNHTLGLMLGGWSVCFVIFQLYVAKLRQPLRVLRAEADTQVTATLADAISNQSTISLFAATKHEQHIFRSVAQSWREKTIQLWHADEWIWAAIGLFMIGIQGALMVGAIHYWQLGLLTVGDFVLIQTYLFGTFDRLVGLNRELRGFYSALAEAGEMLEIMRQPHEVQDRPGALPLSITNAEVHFADVGFAFTSEQPILEHFTLTIADHQKVALVGPSGAGKSTITKLLLRLFDVKSGTISIDNQNIAGVTQDSLRAAISFVPQEPVLFHRTLMENIRYGRLDATDDEVIDAAKKAHCHEFIERLPEQYATFVGERGIKLSGGERQRVAIARAILKGAPLLILDEATSSLDSESESLIQDALRILMQGKTVIVIAHRLSTIMHMDRIVVVEQGHVVADGTHTELLTQNGLYQKLWNIQAGGFLANDETPVLEEGVAEDEEGLE